MIDLYNFINEIGYLSTDFFWFPVLIWTAVSSLTFFILRMSEKINPLYQYHIRIATLFALPIGIISAFVIQYLTKLSSLGNSSSAAVFVVQNPLYENNLSQQIPEAASIQWFNTNFLIGSVSLLIGIIAIALFIKLLKDYLHLKSLHQKLDTEPLTNLESEYGLKDRSVLVAFNDHPLVPFTFGWRNPVIVLPSSIKDNKENLNMALRHELVHIQRGDYLIQLLISMISSAFWFHPLIRISENRIETFREISCDLQVLNTSEINPKKYANMLMELIPLQKGIGSFAINMAVQKSTLKQRIEKMKYHKLHKTSLKKSFMLFLGMIMIVIAPIACSDLQGPSTLSDEEISESELIFTNPEIAINGKEIFKSNKTRKTIGLNGVMIAPAEYGTFIISGAQFEGASPTAEISGNSLTARINEMDFSLISESTIYNEKSVNIWIRHFPNKKWNHNVMGIMPYEVLQSSSLGERITPADIPSNLPVSSNPGKDVFVVVEEMPELIGGQVGIQSKVEYPEAAIRAGIEGRVTVQFVVDTNGNVVNPKIIRGIGGGCDEEALRVVSQAKFTPGTQRGKSVDVQMSMPVLFKLSN